MIRRRWHGAPLARADMQRHHLIPCLLSRQPQMAEFFQQLRPEGFCLQQFSQNGVCLPSNERAALLSGYALHRGPHPGYNDVVSARVEVMRRHFADMAGSDLRGARRVVVMRLHLLQEATRRALTDQHRGLFRLNKRDPMRIFADRPFLDEAIDSMFAEIRE